MTPILLTLTWAILIPVVALTITNGIRLRRHRRTRTGPVFMRSASVGIATDIVCEHGHPALYLQLHHDNGAPITAFIPRCAAARLTGGIHATIQATDPDAYTDFTEAIHHATTHLAHQAHTANTTCCAAAHSTGGREHTCDQKAGGRG